MKRLCCYVFAIGMSVTSAARAEGTCRPASNLAPFGLATASSENEHTSQLAAKAVDGIVDGHPTDHEKEWATVQGREGSTLTLEWALPITIERVVLYDRPNTTDHITAATLVFDDGTTIAVGALDNGGLGNAIDLPAPKTVQSVTLEIDGVSEATLNVGLAEIEVFGEVWPGALLGVGLPQSVPLGFGQIPLAEPGTEFLEDVRRQMQQQRLEDTFDIVSQIASTYAGTVEQITSNIGQP
ncbi:MAG: hypothetical protein OXU20_17380 [Myxococcales bacterium]|nr:hypothetical protein [Myxococcales bacterium]